LIAKYSLAFLFFLVFGGRKKSKTKELMSSFYKLLICSLEKGFLSPEKELYWGARGQPQKGMGWYGYKDSVVAWN